ncbi:hypothetical protein J1605_009123 [Eschrichtius robustus]|uniref:Uncharacterized protein n=1 Tax=Eschrichtius robustus TaxID=9764 RepID=A0AB34GVY2_ESCRO|nr:hypothetical protein J1605_009123 [Eschrichtius robustus]
MQAAGVETDEGSGSTGQETAGASSFWGLLAQFAWKYQTRHGAQSMDFGARQPQLWSQPHHCPGNQGTSRGCVKVALTLPDCHLHLHLRWADNPYVSGTVHTKDTAPGLIMGAGGTTKAWAGAHSFLNQGLPPSVYSGTICDPEDSRPRP